MQITFFCVSEFIKGCHMSHKELQMRRQRVIPLLRQLHQLLLLHLLVLADQGKMHFSSKQLSCLGGVYHMYQRYHHHYQQHFRYPPSVIAQAPPRPLIEELIKYGAIKFRGKKEDDSSTVKLWLESTKRVLKQLQCSPR